MTRIFAAALLAILIAPASCKSKPTVCDPKGLDSLEEALREGPSDHRAEMAAMGLSQACSKGETQLPSGLKRALEGVSGAPPDHRSLVVLRGISEEMGLFGKVCKGGPKALSTMAAVAPDEKLDALWKACGLSDDVGFATRGDLNLQALDQILMALMVHRWLLDGNVDDARAKLFARGLAGL